MVKEGIVLGHRISEKGIEVDRAKVEVIERLPQLISVKGVKSFLGHAGFYPRFIKDFSKIAHHCANCLRKIVNFVLMNSCLKAIGGAKRKVSVCAYNYFSRLEQSI